jgi:hypothetical protein
MIWDHNPRYPESATPLFCSSCPLRHSGHLQLPLLGNVHLLFHMALLYSPLSLIFKVSLFYRLRLLYNVISMDFDT